MSLSLSSIELYSELLLKTACLVASHVDIVNFARCRDIVIELGGVDVEGVVCGTGDGVVVIVGGGSGGVDVLAVGGGLVVSVEQLVVVVCIELVGGLKKLW